jgi:hypothetical protein
MRQRRVRTPNRATANDKPIQRPDTYQRLPEDVQLNSCEQQPVHTLDSLPTFAAVAHEFNAKWEAESPLCGHFQTFTQISPTGAFGP